MVATYCSGTQVAQFLQTTTFSTTTNPTMSSVIEMIERNEDFIDSYTGHSWKETTITNEYIDSKVTQAGLGARFDLQHRKLRTMSSGTDKIEIWNGTAFIDYVATKTEGRGSDYFVDYTDGVVYIMDTNTIYPKGSRFTYRFGESSVDKDVEKAVILLTAADLVSSFDRVATFVDDGASNRMNHTTRANIWREDAYRILDNKKEFKTL